jgi:pimeloyl-ACP methyl ester carboxylesterase
MTDLAAFIDRPGLPGAFGALMDEYARAAEDFCSTVEALPLDRFLELRESADPEMASLQSICAHVVGASYGYAIYIRIARGLPRRERPPLEALTAATPAGVRPLLTVPVHLTEESVQGLVADDATLAGLRFQVRWGPTYDPEMLLEHAIVHLLRHRRQITRWGR